MDPTTIRAAVDEALAGHRLLEHPFYRRWEAGELADGELAAYAEQYRHVERALPVVLELVLGGLPDGPARDLVASSLHDELHEPEPHVDLFESFATAAGASIDAPVGPAAFDLVSLQLGAARDDVVGALAVVAAYEVQAAEVAASKAEGLRAHFGFDEHGTRFWDVHAAMEIDHGQWSLDALDLLGCEPCTVVAEVSRAAKAWWAFLDEREALAPAA
jgi:pyrroloquinoline-quinone synthase